MSAAMTVSALAADLPVEGAVRPYFVAPPPVAQWMVEIGGRYWYSQGRSKVDVFAPPPFVGHLSRLTYTSLQGNSGELFGRADHLSGFFTKGFIGAGVIDTGNLRDEDFPPIFGGYSSTSSDQSGGKLGYAVLDFGWAWRGDTAQIGFFAGYSYYHERLNAYGCAQTGLNPLICAPAIASSVLVITQDTTWNSIRLGMNAQWHFAPGWRVTGDLAWLPYTSLHGVDNHWLRTDVGGAFVDNGVGVSNIQVEAFVTYQFLNGLAVGVGGRYWRFRTDGANTDFPDTPVTWITERWGAFLQASYKFGILRPTRYN
jgi:hypothetical protein